MRGYEQVARRSVEDVCIELSGADEFAALPSASLAPWPLIGRCVPAVGADSWCLSCPALRGVAW